MITERRLLQMGHIEYFDATIQKIMSAIESEEIEAKKIELLSAHLYATLAVYKLLLSELKGNELWRKAIIENTEV